MQLLARFEMNGNREMWTDYCHLNQWLIGETLFIRKRGRLLMVVPGIGSTIWHLARDGGARCMHGGRVMRREDAWGDHQLLAKIRVKKREKLAECVFWSVS